MTYSPFRHIGSIIWKRNPIHLTFFLTRKCNARCPFCFYPPKNGNGGGLTDLSLEEIEKISASLDNLLWLAFSGGEIFLRDDIVEIANVFYKNNKPAIILLSTNGLLPERIRDAVEEILRRCGKSTVVVKLSLDGLKEAHDSLRGVEGAFEKTLRTYRVLDELMDGYRNFELGINTVFCSATQGHMDNLMDFVRRLDRIKTHTVSMIRGEAPDPALKEVSLGRYYKAMGRLESDLKKRLTGTYRFRGARLKAAQDILQRRLIYKTMVRKKRLIPCYAGRLNLVLAENGDLYPCETFERNMGNVRESGYDIRALLKREKARNVVRSIKDNACYCTHECYFITNILFNPSQYPSLLKEYLRI